MRVATFVTRPSGMGWAIGGCDVPWNTIAGGPRARAGARGAGRVRAAAAVASAGERPGAAGIRAGRQAAATGADPRGPARGVRLRVRLDRGVRLPLVDLAPPRHGRARDPGGQQAGDERRPRLMDFGQMSAAHFIFIPAVLLVGLVIGWVLGGRAAQDAYAAELRRREERAKREKS